MQVVLATRNQGKIRELQAMLAGHGVDVLGLDSFPQVGEIEETGATFEANARLKAEAVSKATGLIALADDSGLVVDALDGAPGVYSARYSGENATDASNNEKLLAALDGVPQDKRGCRFVSVVVAHAPDGRELVFEGVWLGRVAFAPQGENGFGYDPLFLDPELGLSAAQMTPEQKNERSHRGRAMRALMDFFPRFAKSVEREAALTPEQRDQRDRLTGVRGWLMLLCVVMIFVGPLAHGLTISKNLKTIDTLMAPDVVDKVLAAQLVRGLTLENVLVGTVGFAFIWTGVGLYRRRRGAVFQAKLAWLAVPAVNLLEMALVSYYFDYPPQIREQALSALTNSMLASTGGAALWVSYLTFSRRVRATYPEFQD